MAKLQVRPRAEPSNYDPGGNQPQLLSASLDCRPWPREGQSQSKLWNLVDKRLLVWDCRANERQIIVKTYSKFRPTGFDSRGLGLPDNQDWLVAPVSQTRDSGPLDRSNFECFLKAMGGETEDVQICRFGHWGPGWFEIVLINPAKPELVKLAEDMENSLADYPVLDDMDFSQKETDEANEVWRNCYRPKDRLEYIRKHRSQFEFHDLRDILGCVRGEYFAGYASALIN